MIAVTGFAIYMIYRYMSRYLAFEVRTEIRYNEHFITSLPVMLFCLSSMMTRKNSCYYGTLSDGTPCNFDTRNTSALEMLNHTSGERSVLKDLGNHCHVFNENGVFTFKGVFSGYELFFETDISEQDLYG